MAELPRLRVGLTLDSATFVREVNRVIESVNRMNRDITRQNAALSRAFGDVNKAIDQTRVALGALATAFAVRQFARFTQDALQAVGGLAEMAAQSGVTTRELQILRLAATQSGVEFGELTSALAQFNRRVGEAAAGNKQIAADFQRMGLAIADSSGRLRTSMDILTDLAEVVQNAGSSQEQFRIANEAMGRSGARLLPILQQGAEGIKAWAEQAEAAGLIVSGQFIANADKAADAVASLQLAFTTGFQVGIIEEFGQAVSSSTEALTQARDIGQDLGRVVGVSMRGLAAATKIAADNFDTLAGAAAAFIAFNVAVKALEVARAFYAVAAALKAAGVAQGLLTLLSKHWLTIAATVIAAVAGFAAFNKVMAAMDAQVKGALDDLDLLSAGFEGIGTSVVETADKMSEMLEAADRENQQLAQLNLAYRGLGSAVEDVQIAMKIDDQLRAAKISRLDAEKSGLLELLVANERLRLSNEKLAKLDEQLARAQEALQDARDKNREASERLTASLQDQLSLQALQLQGLDRESEAYRVQAALLEAKSDAGGRVTAEQERMIRQIEAQATAIDRQIDATQEWEAAIGTARENIQNAFADTFEEIYSGGITSFSDLASEIKDIFIRLAAELTALMIFRPELTGGFGGLFGAGAAGAAGAASAAGPAIIPAMAPAAAGVAGWTRGLTGGPYAYSRVPGPGRSPSIVGLPGTPGATALANNNWWLTPQRGFAGLATAGALGFAGGNILGGFTGSSTGGGIGGALGSIAGMAAPFGGPALAIGGGIAGGLLGGVIGGLFGGGPQSNNVAFGRGALGTIGLGGTGAGAGFIRQFDQQILNILDARMVELANAALANAENIAVKYSKTPSAGDLSNLARGRIGPTATALGFNAAAVTGVAGQLAPEQQLANLQTAIQTQQAIADLVAGFGDFARAARDLKTRFEELRTSAEQFGISVAGMDEAQRAAGMEFLTEGIRQLSGETPTFLNRLNELRTGFRDLERGAVELGLPIEDVRIAAKRAEIALNDQRRAGLSNILQQGRALAGAASFRDALANLRAQFAALRLEAEALNASIAFMTQLTEQQRAAEIALNRQRTQSIHAVLAQGRALGGTSGFLDQFQALLDQFTALRAEARALNVSMGVLTQLTQDQARATAELNRQRTEELSNILGQAQQAIGLPDTWARQVAAINEAFIGFRKEGERLNASPAFLRQINQYWTQAIAEANRRRHEEIAGINEAALQLSGLAPTFSQEMADLNRQFSDLMERMRALGGDTRALARAQDEAAAALRRRQQEEIDAMALSIVDPFERMLDPLREFAGELTIGNLNPAGQMQAAAEEFQRIANLALAGSTTAIQQLQGAGEAFIAQAERFGASPGGVAARAEVSSVIERVIGSVEQAQRDASAGLENVIRLASQREVDTLNELVAEVRLVGEEIRRLRR